MVVFGVFLPAFVAWIISGWIAKRLASWWGALLAATIGFVAGVALPGIAHGVIADYVLNSFDGEGWVRTLATSLLVALLFSIWSTIRARRSIM
jgi:ABC-type antimicrobial peptide transport system permease subunit